MRKDVRFGLVIGGILLAVLVVYVLVVPSKNDAGAQFTEGTPATVDGGAPTEGSNETAVNTGTTPTPGIDTTIAQGPTSRPAEQATEVTQAPAPQPDAPQWADLLARGDAALLHSSPRRDGGMGESHGTRTIPREEAAPSTRPANESSTHIVAKGETLSSISMVKYGTPSYWQKIAAANPNVNPNKLSPGTKLVLPDIKPAAHESTTPAHAPTPAAPAERRSSGSGEGEYKVKPHDTIQSIARTVLGRADQWQKLYELNKSVIGSDPGRIKVGMVLKLPEKTTQLSAR